MLMIKDLTEGNPGKVLWQFTLPMFVSVIFQQLYNIADSVIVGNYAGQGEEALAAVGASYPITMIFMAIAMGCNVGCAVVISQLFGAKRYREMKTAVSTTLLASFFLSVVMTILGVLLSGSMLKMIRTPENIFGDADVYLKIYIGGFIFLFLYNVVTGIFTSLGDSRTPLYFLIGSSLSNIALDWAFVAVFHWDVAGVAWATFICQGIACILALVTLKKRLKEVACEEKPELFSSSMLKKIAIFAIPSVLQQSFVSVGNIFIQSLVNGFGSSVIAGYSAAIKINTFGITCFGTLGNAMSSFTAQNIGAGSNERVKKGLRSGLGMGILIGIPFFLLCFFQGSALVRLFMKEETTVALNTGVQFLKIVSPFYFVVSLKLVTDGLLRGSGAMTWFMVSTFSDLILRVVLGYILAVPFGTTGIWMSWPVGWTIGTIMSLVFYAKGVWKVKKRKQIPSMDEWIKEAKAHESTPKIGMYLTHNGVVRQTAKAKVRFGQEDTRPVTGMIFSYDQGKVDEAIADTYQMEGIFYIRVWLNKGQLQVGDDIMYVLIGGDIRPHVVDALQYLVGRIKNECVVEQERND